MLSVCAEHVVVGRDGVAELLLDVVFRTVVLDLQHLHVKLPRRVQLAPPFEPMKDVLPVAVAREQHASPALFRQQHDRGEVGSRHLRARAEFVP